MVQTNLIKAFIQKILPCYRTRIHKLILVLTSLGLKNSAWRPRVSDTCARLVLTNPAGSFALPLHPHPYSTFLDGSEVCKEAAA